MTEQFAVTGMTCAACSAHVEKAVSRLSGVQSAPVNLMLGSMTVTYDEKAVTEGDIIAAVKAAGYGASPASQTDQGQLRRDQDAALRRRKKHLIWSVVFLVPLFYLSMGHMMGLPLPQVLHTHPLLLACLQLALVIPILILNRNYFTVGFSRLVKLSPNMDSLVAVGAAAGLVYSLIEMGLLAAGQVSGMPDLYFESAGHDPDAGDGGQVSGGALPRQDHRCHLRSAGSGPGECRGAPSGTGAHHPHGGDRGR